VLQMLTPFPVFGLRLYAGFCGLSIFVPHLLHVQ
jgi:hypothetical protein